VSGHTPGKWVARPDPNGSPNDWCIGLDDHVSPVDYIATCSARDARLIAAAPELLEALQDLMRAASLSAARGTPFAIDSPGIVSARAAIDKATE